jgi:hypothetical protein
MPAAICCWKLEQYGLNSIKIEIMEIERNRFKRRPLPSPTRQTAGRAVRHEYIEPDTPNTEQTKASIPDQVQPTNDQTISIPEHVEVAPTYGSERDSSYSAISSNAIPIIELSERIKTEQTGRLVNHGISIQRTWVTQRLYPAYNWVSKRINPKVLAVVIIVLLAGGLGFQRWASSHTPRANSSIKGGNSLAVNNPNGNGVNQLTNARSAISGRPQQVTTPTTMDFSPVVPVGESQLADMGSTNYNSAHNSYTYDDLFFAEPLQVSEQPIPSSYENAAGAVEQIANYLHAATPISTSSGTAYMNTNTKSGLQTVVFSTKGLLILIQSSYQHTTAEWPMYLNSLQ